MKFGASTRQKERGRYGGKRLLRQYVDIRGEIEKAGQNNQIIARIRPDPVYLVLFLILLTVGTVMSFSAGSAYAASQYGDSYYFLRRQLLFITAGAVVALMLVIYGNPGNMRWVACGAYLASILLLVLVLFKGQTGGGAQRWISIGSISVQPSEIAKTGIVMFLAFYMSAREDEIRSRGFNKKSTVCGVVIPALIIGAVAFLVALEHHFSGLIIILAIGAVMMFFGGTRIIWFASGVPVAGIIAAIIMNTDYARSRIESWQNRGADALGSDWQSTQGLYAIGTGGLFGLGLGQSRLKYGYVSQPQNDFVFTIVCEELGFFGAVAIMLLFVALTARGFVLAAHAPDRFSSLVILGLSFKLALQVLLNIGVVSGVLPNTGISLPYFSTGGSAVIMQIIEAGIILCLSRFCTQKRT